MQQLSLTIQQTKYNTTHNMNTMNGKTANLIERPFNIADTIPDIDALLQDLAQHCELNPFKGQTLDAVTPELLMLPAETIRTTSFPADKEYFVAVSGKKIKWIAPHLDKLPKFVETQILDLQTQLENAYLPNVLEEVQKQIETLYQVTAQYIFIHDKYTEIRRHIDPVEWRSIVLEYIFQAECATNPNELLAAINNLKTKYPRIKGNIQTNYDSGASNEVTANYVTVANNRYTAPKSLTPDQVNYFKGIKRSPHFGDVDRLSPGNNYYQLTEAEIEGRKPKKSFIKWAKEEDLLSPAKKMLLNHFIGYKPCEFEYDIEKFKDHLIGYIKTKIKSRKYDVEEKGAFLVSCRDLLNSIESRYFEFEDLKILESYLVRNMNNFGKKSLNEAGSNLDPSELKFSENYIIPYSKLEEKLRGSIVNSLKKYLLQKIIISKDTEVLRERISASIDYYELKGLTLNINLSTESIIKNTPFESTSDLISVQSRNNIPNFYLKELGYKLCVDDYSTETFKNHILKYLEKKLRKEKSGTIDGLHGKYLVKPITQTINNIAGKDLIQQTKSKINTIEELIKVLKLEAPYNGSDLKKIELAMVRLLQNDSKAGEAKEIFANLRSSLQPSLLSLYRSRALSEAVTHNFPTDVVDRITASTSGVEILEIRQSYIDALKSETRNKNAYRIKKLYSFEFFDGDESVQKLLNLNTNQENLSAIQEIDTMLNQINSLLVEVRESRKGAFLVSDLVKIKMKLINKDIKDIILEFVKSH
jgi:hypothetical protein